MIMKKVISLVLVCICLVLFGSNVFADETDTTCIIAETYSYSEIVSLYEDVNERFPAANLACPTLADYNNLLDEQSIATLSTSGKIISREYSQIDEYGNSNNLIVYTDDSFSMTVVEPNSNGSTSHSNSGNKYTISWSLVEGTRVCRASFSATLSDDRLINPTVLTLANVEYDCFLQTTFRTTFQGNIVVYYDDMDLIVPYAGLQFWGTVTSNGAVSTGSQVTDIY